MNPIFAMDTSFSNSLGSYDFDVRCEMLRELGYDGTYLTVGKESAWGDVPSIRFVRDRYGLDVCGVYANLDIMGDPDDKSHRNQRVVDLCARLEGCDQLDVCLRAVGGDLSRSDPAGDDRALAWVERLLRARARPSMKISLYPHRGAWMELSSDAVRLCSRMRDPAVGITFSGYHWYAAEGGDVHRCLEEAGPYLTAVNVCGCERRGSGSDAPVSIRPLGEGELDNFALLGAARAAGFAGPVGLQGFSVGGDAYDRLRASLRALRDMLDRLDRHPGWARLRPPEAGWSERG